MNAFVSASRKDRVISIRGTSQRNNANHSYLKKSFSGTDVGVVSPSCCSHAQSIGGVNVRQICGCEVDENGCDFYKVVRSHSDSAQIPNMDFSHESEQRIIRNRSGSWTGVNESEEDIESLVNQNNRRQVLVSSTPLLSDMAASYPPSNYQPSYQSNYSSYMPRNRPSQSESSDAEEERVRRRLKFFFMNPIEKWHAKKRFPWKLLVQIIKILICTSQLCVFASQRYDHVTYLWDTKISFSHLFIQGWDSSREVAAYPPASGPLALYKIQEFYDFMDYAIQTFSTIENTAIGDYDYNRLDDLIIMPEFCLSQYLTKSAPANASWADSIVKKCVLIPTSVLNDSSEWSTKNFLESQNITIDFGYLIDASFSFILQTFKILPSNPTPECYSLETSIYFDNSDHDGQMMVELDIGAVVMDCEANLSVKSSSSHTALQSLLNVATILICAMSLSMCLRAIVRAQYLRSAVSGYFRTRYHRVMTLWEKYEFVNLWYVAICMSDVLVISGSIIKMSLESQKHNFGRPHGFSLSRDEFDYEGYLDKWNVCSLLLGTGNLFIWFGCLRYFGFFETYNVLILTLKSCFPNVLRYSSCILMLFSGYSLCGWLVLGPYHFKFRSLSMTAECLYSLINGDDMFATFSSTIGKDLIVWWFSRIYIYTFCSLFIYVILSLFIAIITDAYETIKRYYEQGFPVSDLKAFANQCRADLLSGDFHDGERTVQDIIYHICCCCRGIRVRRSSSEYEPLNS